MKDDIYEGYHIPAGSVMHALEWSIGRDPEMFPEPDTFNPMRWLDCSFPTYQEPLTKYPSITGYSQFGYGRRLCTGMGVVEADLFVGIGAMAWMFRMSAEGVTEDVKPTAAVPSPSEELTDMNEHATPSGMQTPPSESEIEALLAREKSPMARKQTLLGKKNMPPVIKVDTETIGRAKTVSHRLRIPGEALPGQFPAFFEERTDSDSPKRIFATAGTDDMPSVNHAVTKTEPGKADPTLEYSSLLIAKPLPFKFSLQIRDRKKADHVARQWLNLMMDGELSDSKCYWEGGNAGNAMYGWGQVDK